MQLLSCVAPEKCYNDDCLKRQPPPPQEQYKQRNWALVEQNGCSNDVCVFSLSGWEQESDGEEMNGAL